MVAKSVKLGGYGVIMINPIVVKEQDWETVDPSGNPVTAKVEGTRAKTVYYNTSGVAIPNNQLCKKIEVEDEVIIAPKFGPTKEVANEDIEVLDDNSIIYSALERKFYAVTTDHERIKDLVLKQNKSLKTAMTYGSGWKVWSAVLTNWNGKLLLVACRGDLVKELEKYSEDTVELQIEVLPQAKNMKKLVKAMAMV
jgi:hypothetical protein